MDGLLVYMDSVYVVCEVASLAKYLGYFVGSPTHDQKRLRDVDYTSIQIVKRPKF